MSRELRPSEISTKIYESLLDATSYSATKAVLRNAEKQISEYANHVADARLEAYKAELMEWVDSKVSKWKEYESFYTKNYHPQAIERAQSHIEAHQDLLLRLKENLRAPEYTEAEQNCKGCFGPCGYCRTKED